MLKNLSLIKKIILSLSLISLYSCGGSTVSKAGPQENATNYKTIRVTDNEFRGNIGSDLEEAMTEADGHCAAEFGSAFKALLGSSIRNLSIHWILSPNTEYRREDGLTVIGTTNASATFDFPLENPITADPKPTWTGLTTAWEVSNNNCNDWTSSSSSFEGARGVSGSVTEDSISINSLGCANSFRLYCVEQ